MCMPLCYTRARWDYLCVMLKKRVVNAGNADEVDQARYGHSKQLQRYPVALFYVIATDCTDWLRHGAAMWMLNLRVSYAAHGKASLQTRPVPQT